MAEDSRTIGPEGNLRPSSSCACAPWAFVYRIAHSYFYFEHPPAAVRAVAKRSKLRRSARSAARSQESHSMPHSQSHYSAQVAEGARMKARRAKHERAPPSPHRPSGPRSERAAGDGTGARSSQAGKAQDPAWAVSGRGADQGGQLFERNPVPVSPKARGQPVAPATTTPDRGRASSARPRPASRECPSWMRRPSLRAPVPSPAARRSPQTSPTSTPTRATNQPTTDNRQPTTDNR